MFFISSLSKQKKQKYKEYAGAKLRVQIHDPTLSIYLLYPGYRHRYRHLEFTPVNIGISQMDQSIGESILGRWINPWAKSGNIFSYLVSEDFWLIHV